MSSNNRPKGEASSFDDVVDLGSIPPPPGVVGPDVHAARTAVAALPSSLLEELRRAKHNDPAESNRTRRQEKFELPSLAKRGGSFTNEAPTRPGKDGMRLLRPQAPDAEDVPPPSPGETLSTARVEKKPAIRKVSPVNVPVPVPVPEPPAPIEPTPVIKTPPMATPAPPIVVVAPIPTPAPIVAPMVEQTVEQVPDERAPAPRVRIQFLVALVIVASAAFVLAAMAIAERVLIRR